MVQLARDYDEMNKSSKPLENSSSAKKDLITAVPQLALELTLP